MKNWVLFIQGIIAAVAISLVTFAIAQAVSFGVFQGGTGASTFSANSIIVSGTSALNPLTASNTPMVSAINATSTGATSTFNGGIYILQGFRVDDLVSCDTINTDSAGFFVCGVDATGAGASNWSFVSQFVITTSSTQVAIIVNAASSTISNLLVSFGTTTRATTTSLAVSSITSALVLAGADGSLAEYAGIDCTNQFVRDVSAAGAGTCATITSADVDLADLTATNGTLTFSGTYDGQTARTIGLNLGSINSWTAIQTFSAGIDVSTVGATTTSLAVSGTASTSNLIVNGARVSGLRIFGFTVSSTTATEDIGIPVTHDVAYTVTEIKVKNDMLQAWGTATTTGITFNLYHGTNKGNRVALFTVNQGSSRATSGTSTFTVLSSGFNDATVALDEEWWFVTTDASSSLHTGVIQVFGNLDP